MYSRSMIAATAVLLLAGCGGDDGGGDEGAYLAQVEELGVSGSFRGDGDAVEAARGLCTLLDNGASSRAELVEVTAQSRDMSGEQASGWVDAATAAFCPDFA